MVCMSHFNFLGNSETLFKNMVRDWFYQHAAIGVDYLAWYKDIQAGEVGEIDQIG